MSDINHDTAHHFCPDSSYTQKKYKLYVEVLLPFVLMNFISAGRDMGIPL